MRPPEESTLWKNEAFRHLIAQADASRDHGVLTEFFGSDYEDSSDLESLGSDSSEGFDEQSDDIPLE